MRNFKFVFFLDIKLIKKDINALTARALEPGRAREKNRLAITKFTFFSMTNFLPFVLFLGINNNSRMWDSYITQFFYSGFFF